MSDQIIVIGGGVSGLTTAITLQLLGYETEIITEKIATKTSNKNSHPEFASLFPSASVIPHSVYSDQLEELFLRSQSVFYELRKLTFPGVTMHKHYEIFEDKPERPEYCNWMLNFQPFDKLDPEDLPQRPGADKLFGWAFDCIFADWTLYLPALYDLYTQIGGTITTKKLESDDIFDLEADVIVNCSGTGSPSLFEDPSEDQLLMRGHLLQKPNAPLITNTEDEIVSYNYTPSASVYADAQGNACDVYCYPRKDGWVLGGSRQIGQLGQSNWSEITASSYKIDGIPPFPKQIIDVNNQILSTTYDKSLSLSDDLELSVGYRYIRNHKNGLRMENETVRDKQIIHNYGHGGAGVTLSWGCAIDIAHCVASQGKQVLRQTLLKKIEKGMAES